MKFKGLHSHKRGAPSMVTLLLSTLNGSGTHSSFNISFQERLIYGTCCKQIFFLPSQFYFTLSAYFTHSRVNASPIFFHQSFLMQVFLIQPYSVILFMALNHLVFGLPLFFWSHLPLFYPVPL